jgi:hypothetical protein
MEYNMGKLTPYPVGSPHVRGVDSYEAEQYARLLMLERGEGEDDIRPYACAWDKVCDDPGYYELGTFINGVLYKITWDAKGEDPVDGFANVEVLDDGSIKFETLHHNSCGLEDVIQGEIKRQEEADDTRRDRDTGAG